MSGIIALFGRGGNGIARDEVEAMIDQIDHRGPDGEGLWLDDNVGLGYQHLRSTPEGKYDEQPYREGDYVVTADVRLDNREELLSALSISESPDRVPDSRLLVAAYREWGQECVDHLVGAYAFVIWDGSSKQVFCARDHLGVKPLYYHLSEDVFAVASEMKSILTLPFDPTLDEVKIGDFLVGRFGDKSNTYYEEIRRLPPAHATTVGTDGAEMWQYWDLDPTRTITLDSDAAYERRFRELFEEAVRCRLRTNDPVGTTLSGGMDSSSVTVMARDLLPENEPLHTFSWVFDEAQASDEREYIEAVTEMSGIDAHYLFLDDIGVLVDHEEVFNHLDEPPFNSMHYAWWETAKRAADVGTGVVMDGALGDSAISYGLGLLPDLFRMGRWRQLYTELRQLSERRGASFSHLIKHQVIKPLIPEPIVRRHQQYRGTPVLEERMNPTLNPDFIEQIDFRSRYKELYSDWSFLGQSAREQQYHSIQMGLTTANLEMIDMRHTRFGIEPRHPFADKRLIEFSLAMPADQQLWRGQTRSIIRRSLDDVLPKRVRNRVGKTSVSEGFWNALVVDSDSLEKMMAQPDPLPRYVDVDALRDAFDRLNSDQVTDPAEARALWRALSLLRWFDGHNTQIDAKNTV